MVHIEMLQLHRNVTSLKLLIHVLIFFRENEHHLQPKPKLTFKHLRKVILAFHSKFVLVPADKAPNNIIIVWCIHYIYVLHNQLNSTNAYSKSFACEKDIVNNYITNISNLKVQINEKEPKIHYFKTAMRF
jgi:hypothetical protein